MTYSHSRTLVAALMVFLPYQTTLFSQQVAGTGNVEGYIFCSDTQHPARMAQVRLYPLTSQASQPSSAQPSQSNDISTVVGIKGNFSLSRIQPGDYYVSAELPGYIDANALFDGETLKHPTSELRDRIANSIVTVVAEKTVNINLTLHRGGSISGTIRYDDGVPAPVMLIAMSRTQAGGWANISESHTNANDLGRFRIAGLPAGEYVLHADLLLADSHSIQALTVFSGDTVLSSNAKIIKLGDGEEVAGSDITIPISKLHRVTGSLFNQSGETIKQGEVALYDSSNNAVGHSLIGDGVTEFRMDLIPEGHYTLRVTNARDVSPNTPHVARVASKEVVLRTYGSFETLVEVIGDMTGMSITVPSRDK